MKRLNKILFTKFDKQRGFSLAEVLITLGIIGVVAALTIPMLLQEHQKRVTVNKLKRAVSIINQAYKMSFDDNGEPENITELGAREYFKQYWAPYIKVATFCESYKDCGYTSNTPFQQLNGNIDLQLIYPQARVSFFTSDGFMYNIFIGGGTIGVDYNVNTFIRIDINGGAGPNRLGRDVFWFNRVEGKGVLPYGQESSDDIINNECKFGGVGRTCAEKIRRAGWEIDKSYPFK